MKSTKQLLIIFLLIPVFTIAQKPFAIVELFTSEGCNSCPAADGVLSKTAKKIETENKNVFFLEYHVDYWNKGGWKDPFSKNQFTLRQENYSRVLPEKELYTPEAVVNGTFSFTGSNESKLNEYINKSLLVNPQLKLTSRIDSIANDTIFMSYDLSESNANFVLKIAITEDDLSSVVAGGENKGRVLHHDHVVRLLISHDKPVKTGQVKIALKGMKITAKHKLIVFLQHKQTMKIEAAEMVDLK
jgi:hypothetical protein